MEEAYDNYASAKELGPDLDFIPIERAKLCYKAGWYERGIAEMNEMIARRRISSDVYRIRADMHASLGQMEEAMLQKSC
jgi:predicted Zn-dependent protease